ncbi:unnamed protein product [Acanthoscelides obtectus]|uniref:Uncharacterized protein n=1 Tax=Acanthoscelides obtectus TaxID=200917 RepID=A0A9P0LN25_ACAOB|nr:unnamed protein product [Acanthoscelides obtectus]CAK1632688.1 hypothetical protein AOBTE_LOCUS7678 [Acanthoscelides obtectus]
MYTCNFFRNIQQNVLEVIEDKLRVYRALKVNMEVFGQYVLQSKDVVDIKSFDTTDTVIDMGVDLSNVYKQFTDEIISQSSEFEEKDSGWATKTILFAEVNINKFSPFGGSSFIKLPHFIEKKKAIINVQNKDEYCFAWAVTSALMPAHAHPAQTSSYLHFSTILNVNEVVKFAFYRGETASKKFITELEADLKFLYFKYMKDVTPIIPSTSDEQNEFDIATICNICEKSFSGEDI